MRSMQSELKRVGMTPKRTQNKKKRTQNAKKSNRKFSDHELRDLMGTNRPTYQRHKGAMRQK